jgi:CheY-like chemotaxis protein
MKGTMMNTYNIDSTDGVHSEYLELLEALSKTHEKAERCVLVVDDEPTVRRMVSRSMRALDKELTVHEAENGQEALSILEEIRAKGESDPVLIVTDLQMPVMDGWDFIEKLRKDYEARQCKYGIPVVVLSSSTGVKGIIARKSVHGDKSKYRPIASVAKENCIKPFAYDAAGARGVLAWAKYFLTDQK